MNVLGSHFIDLALVSSYFEHENYENPVNHYMQDSNIFYLIPSLSQKIVFQVITYSDFTLILKFYFSQYCMHIF